MSKLADIILSMSQAREDADRRAATHQRTLNAGRCGRCRKKAYDCRCGGSGEFKEELPSASLMLPNTPTDDTRDAA